MSINEVFPNPTVKHVIFQIRFPNLFYIENKIGDIQGKIMNMFPESALLYRRNIIFADVGKGLKIEDIMKDSEEKEGFVRKIWQFTSENKYKLSILNDSLDISSEFHKTYNLGKENKFRDVIEFVLKHFLEIVSVPIINRIGLRYIDECPTISKNNDDFINYFNTTFPLKRFDIKNANDMQFKTVVKNDKYYLRYVETLKLLEGDGEKCKLILDFDGFCNNIEPKNCMAVTDKLHDLISAEYEKTIKKPVYEYMKKPKEI